MTYKDFFEPQLLEDAWDKYTNEDNYAVLCLMPPTLFSSLAEQRLFPGAMEDLPKPDKGGPKWNSLPALAIGDCRYDSMIIDHDGRHRSMYLIAQGIPEMLVLLYLNVKPLEMSHRVINEDRNRLYHLPSNIVQVRNNIISNGFPEEEWSDNCFNKSQTRAFYRAYFDGGGEFIC